MLIHERRTLTFKFKVTLFLARPFIYISSCFNLIILLPAKVISCSQACPVGYRADADGICQACVSSPVFYDWMYLAFMAVLSLTLHFFFIDFTNKKKNNNLFILHLSALLESIIAAICSLLVVPPFGQLMIKSCPVVQLADWYTLFFNPTPDYVNVIHCTQEAVYPLYTLVFIYYAFSLAVMLIARPIVSSKLVSGRGTRSIYAALYFFPILICLHAVLAGLVYYSYPYIILTASVITNALHFSLFKQQTTINLLKLHVTDFRNTIILICHWILHAFGIVSLTTQLKDPVFHAPLLCLVPLPALIYITTVKFTNPDNLDTV